MERITVHLQSSTPTLRSRNARVYILNATATMDKAMKTKFGRRNPAAIVGGSTKFGVTPGGGGAAPTMVEASLDAVSVGEAIVPENDSDAPCELYQ
jgi:hypothetical protein